MRHRRAVKNASRCVLRYISTVKYVLLRVRCEVEWEENVRKKRKEKGVKNGGYCFAHRYKLKNKRNVLVNIPNK
jgi:hypothetical protein